MSWERLRALEAGVAEPEWFVDRLSDYSEGHRWHIADVLRWGGHQGMRNALSFSEDEETAEFVAAARNAVPVLLAQLDAVAALHVRTELGECAECRASWPCPTIEAIGGGR